MLFRKPLPSKFDRIVRSTIETHLESTRVTALVDQGVLAVSRFLIIVGSARLLPAPEFGIVSLVVSTAYLAAYVQRALVGLPFVISCATPDALELDGSDWFWFSTALAGLIGLICVLLSGVLFAASAAEWLVSFLAMAAVAGPACWIYEFSRRWVFQWRKPRVALLQAGGFSLAVLATFAWFTSSPSLLRASLVLSIPYLLPSAATLIQCRPLYPVWSSFPRTWLKSWAMTKWTLGDAALRLVDGSGIQLWLAIIASPASAGVYMAGRNAVAPVFTLLSAIELAELPKLSHGFAERNVATLKRSLGVIAVAIALVVLPYIGAVYAFAAEIMRWLYGSNFAGYGSVLRWWAIVQLLAACTMPFEWLLLSSLRSKTLFSCRALGIAVIVAACAFLIGPLGVTGALIADAAGTCTTLICAVCAVARNALRSAGRLGTAPFEAG